MVEKEFVPALAKLNNSKIPQICFLRSDVFPTP
jgi:hypothetical protein